VHQFAMPFSDFKGLLDIGTYRFAVAGLSVYLELFDVSMKNIFHYYINLQKLQILSKY
jgi:hypothetical protein